MTHTDTKQYSFADLIDVMARLRDPNGGCPWDLEQNFDTIAPYTIEEAYEVEEAIKRKDFQNLREELGDLLFQPVYHAQMASELGHFTINDVIHDITSKMIARHPHVFGEAAAGTPADVDVIWDQQKAKEKPAETNSVLDHIPRAFPALLRAHKLQKKAAKVGFEWPDIGGVIDKLDEEITELNEAMQSGDAQHVAEELGDVLFVLVNYARMSGMNAEDIMRAANDKFERRFRALEAGLKAKGLTLEDAKLDQMEDQWQTVKQQEKSSAVG